MMKVKSVLAIVVMMICFLGGAVFQAYAGQGKEPAHTLYENDKQDIVVIVNSGDTLWSIARNYVNDGEDVRDLIAEIKDVNQLQTSILQIGQALIIPTNS